MPTTNYTHFAQWLTIIFGLYRCELTEELLELYWILLQRFTLDELKYAANRHFNSHKEGKYLPTPSHLLQYLQFNPHTAADNAWYKLLNAIRQHGCYNSVTFDDAHIHCVVQELGGWLELCRLKTYELQALHRPFHDDYVQLCENGLPKKYPRFLAGITPLTDSNGRLTQPCFVGDPILANAVWQGKTLPPKNSLAGLKKIIASHITDSAQENLSHD